MDETKTPIEVASAAPIPPAPSAATPPPPVPAPPVPLAPVPTVNRNPAIKSAPTGSSHPRPELPPDVELNEDGFVPGEEVDPEEHLLFLTKMRRIPGFDSEGKLIPGV